MSGEFAVAELEADNLLLLVSAVPYSDGYCNDHTALTCVPGMSLPLLCHGF